jgi:hypothetical protein
MTPSVPPRAAQHTTRSEALQQANKVRLARAQVKRDVRAGVRTVGEVLTNPSEDVLSMAIVDLLLAQKWWGEQRVITVLRGCGVGWGVTVRRLTPRQLAALVLVLEEGPPLQATERTHTVKVL